MRSLFRGVIIGASLLMPAALVAQPTIAQSSFTAGAEGWQIADFYPPLWLDPNNHLFWQATGGNPDGYIGENGDARAPSSIEGFLAPGAFLGDKSAAFGGTLNFYLEALLGHDPGQFPTLVLSDGTTTLQYRTTLAGLGWTSYAIPLHGGGGWEVVGSPANYAVPGPVATDAQMQTVLANLSMLTILADQRGGEDLTGLDEVRLLGPSVTATPEPATLWLLGSGLIAVGVAVRRRRVSTPLPMA